MRRYVDRAWKPMQQEFFDNQGKVEEEALRHLKVDRTAALRYLTRYTSDQCNRALDKAWETGDLIWTKFDGAW